MSGRAIQDRKDIGQELFVQRTAHPNANVSAGSAGRSTIWSTRIARDYGLASAAEDFYETTARSSLPMFQADANLVRALQQLLVIAQRQMPRIAFKAKGGILLLDLAELSAIQAEGNYVSLRHQRNSYLIRETLSSVAEKLSPYGFIRIHRSVVVNRSVVEQIQPLRTGECRLRLRDGKEYLVTRKYKHTLNDLAQLWVGAERVCR